MPCLNNLQFDARLVEETVLLGIAGDARERMFRQQRDPIYEVADAELREKRFHDFHLEWFQRLQLQDPFTSALSEQPILLEKTRLCAVMPSPSRKDEGADLHGAYGQLPAVIIRLRPITILNKDALLPFLRHELMRAADMLNPSFAYEPFLPPSALGPSHDNLIRERYRVLWDSWISGRLDRGGWIDGAVRSKRRNRFAAAFSFLGPSAEGVFTTLYESEHQTHRGLLDIAQGSEAHPQVCPSCRFPAQHFGRDGLCVQCADMYQSIGEKSFPGRE